MNSPYHNTLHSSWRKYTTKYQSIREPEPGARKLENQSQRTRVKEPEPEPEPESESESESKSEQSRSGGGGERKNCARPQAPRLPQPKARATRTSHVTNISANPVAIYDL